MDEALERDSEETDRFQAEIRLVEERRAKLDGCVQRAMPFRRLSPRAFFGGPSSPVW